MSINSDKKRMLHYDLLRIFAAFSVVMLHSAAQFWYTLDIHESDWLVANSYNAVFRFGVPVFVMISGAMFLNNDYKLNIKRLYQHNILRLIFLYILWSCIYGLWDCRSFDLQAAGLKVIIREMIMGRYHLWFLPMLVGIYVLLPVLKDWLDHTSEKNIRYFLILFMVLQIGGETLRALTVTNELHYLLDMTQVEMACSYVGYFVWGYYLSHIGVSRKICRVIYLCMIPAVICNILLGNYLALRAGEAVGAIYDSYGIFTFIIVTGLYLFAVNYISKVSFGRKSSSLLRELSADTLGVYVMHVGLIEWLEGLGIHSMILPNIIGIPLLALFCFVVCLLASALLRRIPLVGKYIF